VPLVGDEVDVLRVELRLDTDPLIGLISVRMASRWFSS